MHGQGVHMASVVAILPNGSAVSSLTNPDGHYEIDGLPPGELLGVRASPVTHGEYSAPPGSERQSGLAEWAVCQHVLPRHVGLQPVHLHRRGARRCGRRNQLFA